MLIMVLLLSRAALYDSCSYVKMKKGNAILLKTNLFDLKFLLSFLSRKRYASNNHNFRSYLKA